MKGNSLIKLLVALIVLCAITAWYGCSGNGSEQETGRMRIGGADCRLSASKTPPARLLEEAEGLVQLYEQSLSDQGDKSQIVKINAAAGQRPVQVDEHVIEVLKKSLNYARLSDGRYDPSAAPVYELWEKRTEENRVVRRSLVHSALEQVDFRRIRVNEGMRQVYIPDEAMRISMQPGMDGFIVDKAAELFQRNGVTDVCLSKGIVRRAINGNSQYTFSEEVLYENGEKQSGYVGKLKNLKSKALVTLYSQKRLFINLNSGFPAENGLICLVSFGPEAYAAEILAFTVAAGDLHSGIALVEEMPFFEVLCITEDQEIMCTTGVEPLLSEINPDYTLRVFDPRVKKDMKKDMEKDTQDEQVAYLRSVVPAGITYGKNILRGIPHRTQRN